MEVVDRDGVDISDRVDTERVSLSEGLDVVVGPNKHDTLLVYIIALAEISSPGFDPRSG